MANDARLSWKLTRDGDQPRLSLHGELDETSQLETLTLAESTIAIDLEGVSRVTSFGIREWVNFIRRAQESCGEVRLVRCPAAMVRQFNMVPATRTGAVIESVFLPYFCDDCDEERNEFLLEVQGDEPPNEPPAHECPECGGELEFDDVPESYFAFWNLDSELTDQE